MRPPHELSATAMVSRRSRSWRAALSAKAVSWVSSISAVWSFGARAASWLATRAIEFAGGPANVGGIRMFTIETADLYTGPIIPVAAQHAREADETRTLNPAVLTAVRQSDVLALAASPRIGGHGAAIGTIGHELEALAGACASTAWCVWNHLCVFHLFCGVLGPDHAEFLAAIVDRHEWVCFPAGAGSGILGADGGDSVQLSGRGAFGSGARYADWAGVAFAIAGPDGGARRPLDLRFTVVRLDEPGVSIDATWDGAALRASSTDDVHYQGVAVPLTRCAPWYGADRAIQVARQRTRR